MEKDTSMNKKVIVGTLVGCLFGATIGYSASAVNLPHTFTAGTPIKASEVNANFSALSQEIANVKSAALSNKSSNFSEMAITPISAAVGSTITIGSKSFVIKQQIGLGDPITGKKYTLNYPELVGAVSSSADEYVVTSCKDIIPAEHGLIVRMGNGNGFTSYVALQGFANNILTTTTKNTGMRIYIQPTDNNFCVGLRLEEVSFGSASPAIDRATELQKYISLQAS